MASWIQVTVTHVPEFPASDPCSANDVYVRVSDGYTDQTSPVTDDMSFVCRDGVPLTVAVMDRDILSCDDTLAESTVPVPREASGSVRADGVHYVWARLVPVTVVASEREERERTLEDARRRVAQVEREAAADAADLRADLADRERRLWEARVGILAAIGDLGVIEKKLD